MASRGGAIYSTYSQIDISDVMFVGNEANGGSDGTDAVNLRKDTNTLAQMARGGAADFNYCRVTISSTTFKQNRAQDGVRAAGGALAVGEGSVVEATRCWFDRNKALRGGQVTNGGALRLDDGASFRAVDTNFDRNAVDAPAEGFGGAIVTEGLLVLGGGVSFRGNIVYGNVRAAGGAIAVLSATASFNASELPGPVFVGNAVRLAPRPVSQLQAFGRGSLWHPLLSFQRSHYGMDYCRAKAPSPSGGPSISKPRARLRSYLLSSSRTLCSYAPFDRAAVAIGIDSRHARAGCQRSWVWRCCVRDVRPSNIGGFHSAWEFGEVGFFRLGLARLGRRRCCQRRRDARARRLSNATE